MHILLGKNAKVLSEITDLEEVKTSLQEKSSLVWLDLAGDTMEQSREVLTDLFGFHPLSVDDALVEVHTPKIDDWADYVYMSLMAIDPGQPLDDINKSIELDIFLGENYIVTYHPNQIQAVEKVWGNIVRNESQIQRGSRYILYQIIDELADDYMKMIDSLDLKVETIEDLVVVKPNPKILEEIFAVKRSLLNLKRIVAPQREVLNKLARGDFSIVSPKERMYFSDVYDHLVHVHEIIESLRDLVSGTLDIYLSVVNNQLNSIMKTLTIITTLFMPLSFLTGFFGMNFFAASNLLNRWTGATSFSVAMVLMIGLPLGMLLWMRGRDWM